MSESVTKDTRLSKDELEGQRIARKVMREMLSSTDHRRDIDAIAERYVEGYAQMLYARKHIRIYCRQLTGALRKLP